MSVQGLKRKARISAQGDILSLRKCVILSLNGGFGVVVRAWLFF
jgi:hypothetical protein